MTTLDQNGDWALGDRQRTNVYANGALVAAYDSGCLHFQVSNPLGSRRVQTDQQGWYEAAFVSLPYGDGPTPIHFQHAAPTAADATPLHFTGKHLDAETQNDYFGARYYNWHTGRFLIPDWSAKVEPVPYAKLDDPQSLNLYDYMRNNPLGGVDADGHCFEDACVLETAGAITLGVLATVQAINTMQHTPSGSFSDFASSVASSFKADVHAITNIFSSRHGAMNDAKRDAGVPTSQQPEKQAKVPLTDSNGKQVVVNGKPQTTREYTHTTGGGQKVVIQDHKQGHSFSDGGSVGSHVNVRPANDTRHGTVEGTKPHYPYGS